MSRNRKMMNVTRLAMLIAPVATRKPPTPSTTSSETCSAMPATGTTSAETFAMRTPTAYASVAREETDDTSRSVAPAARTVRIDPTARSTPEASSPTLVCCSVEAVRMRPLRSTTTTTETPITTTISSRRIGSMIAIATSAPTKMSELPTASARPCVSTAYNRVVSVPTRETRSPVRRASNSLIGRWRMRAMSFRRLE
jgi:hypothetical protein